VEKTYVLINSFNGN